ncbi:phage tail tape measure protein [Lacticaseibacillus hulanensis]|uniref:phage tail tape measure protein n=1 Tax=Lacticaseibacillus hulanensis TaxID=2493111 RepID=UPI000FD87043|nr:phage tail tape measure protein [Lacticaseibacillus hulanensis]
MSEKISAEMSTEVALDTLKASKSIKDLTAVVKSATNAWKAQEAVMKSQGDYLKAAEARYKGLGTAIEKSQDKIDLLKKKQQDVNVTTQEGAAAYLRYQKQIDDTTKKMASMQAQQTRAKQSIDLQKSGVIELNKQIKTAGDYSRSYVERLTAEGKAQQANVAKYQAMRSEYRQQGELYQKQVGLLKQIEAQSGKTSAEYQKQATRVNELGAKMASAKSEMMKMATSSNVTSTRIAKMGDAANKVGSVAKSAFSKLKGGLVAVGAAAATSTAMIVSGAKQASSLQAKYTETTNLLVNGGEKQAEVTKNIAQMQKDGAEYSMKYGKSQQSIAEGYEDLVKRGYSSQQSLGAMETELQASVASGDKFADVVTVSSQALESFGLRGKTTAEMTKNTKMAVNELAYAADATASGFSDMGVGMSYVGSTAKQLNYSLGSTAAAMGVLSNNGLEADKAGTGLRKVLNSLTDPNTKALKQIGLTAKSFRDAKGNLIPLTDAMELLNKHTAKLSTGDKSVIFKSLFGTTGMAAGQILASQADELEKITKKTEEAGKSGDYVQKMADKNNKSAQQSMARFKQSANNLEIMMASKLLPVMSDAADALTKGLADPKNQKMMKKLASSIGDAAEGVLNFAKYAIAHKDEVKTFAEIIAGIWAVNKAATFIKSIKEVVGLLGDAKTAAGKFSAVNYLSGASGKTGGLAGVGQSLKSAGGFSGLTTAGKVASGISVAGIALDAGTDIYKAFTSKNMTKKFEAAGSATGKAVGGGIGLFFGGPLGAAVGTKIGGIIGKWGGKAAKGFTDGWNKAGRGKKPEGWLEGIGWNARKMGDKVADWWKSMSKKTKAGQAKVDKDQAAANKRNKKTWNSFWDGVGKGWTSFWSTTAKKQKTAHSSSEKQQAANNKAMKKAWNSFWGDTKKGWSSFWGKVGDYGHSGMDSLHDYMGKMSDKISTAWGKFTKSLGKKFSSIWDGIKSAAKTGMNGVIGVINGAISAINAVWKFFSGHKALSKLDKLATGGTITAQQKLVMVNDDGTSDPRELIVKHDGTVGMLQGANVPVMLEQGDTVIPSGQTKSIMQASGIEHYAQGGVIGGVKSFLGGVWDKATAVGKWIAHPQQAVNAMVQKAVSGQSGTFSKLGADAMEKLAGNIADWFKGKLKKIEKELDSFSGSYSAKMIEKAADKMNVKLTASSLKTIQHRVQKESGGNEKITQQISDINSRAGHPAQGLLQYIPSTFASWAVKGHKNILSGYDQLLAMFNDSNWLKDISAPGGWGPTGHKRFANGGLIAGATKALIGEDGPEAVIPLSAAKSSRAWQLLGQVVRIINGNGQNSGSNDVSDSDGTADKIDTLIELVKQMGETQVKLLKIIADKSAVVDVRDLTKAQAPLTATKNLERQKLSGRGLAIETRN